MDLLLFIAVPNAIYLAVAIGLHLWIRYETRSLVDTRMQALRRISAAVLFAPGLLVSGHAVLPGFALGALLLELYLEGGRLSSPSWQLGFTLVPMLSIFLLLSWRDRRARIRAEKYRGW